MTELATILACALAVFYWRRSTHLRHNESLARSCMRDAIRSRDEYVKEFYDERAKFAEMRFELECYREESIRRERERASAMKAAVN